ncbi:hypothetical protein GRI89_12915 [Altererythrobacter salegens]|uniref:Cysteine biosynthesis protein n=1 Tax=Croceibacterium salegens TaxID=1737568 RepID=A0A6I4SYJ6_9SPHN|nr:EI24 domain-containing protein [Croceibacterium salegens]MXO60439.1 hypothetical protein [Croceibacterium salegens]
MKQAPLGLPTALMRGAGALAEGAVLRLLGKVVALTAAVFLLLGWVASKFIADGLSALGLDHERGASVLISAILIVFAGWLLFRVVALFILQFYGDEVVVAVERRSYPLAAERARKLGLAEEARLALGSAGRTLLANGLAVPFALALLFTGIGTAAVFWAVNAWLLGRELTDMVWLRHRPTPETPAPVGRLERFLFGGAVAALMFVPFANLVAPVLGAAAATHLVHGRMRVSNEI